MTNVPRRRLVTWSVRTYALMLHAYPADFRHAFGESMTQLFGDLARDAWTRSGPAGLLMVWARMIVDLFESLVDAHVSEGRQPMSRVVLGAGILYLCALALTTGYGATRYGQFYEAPAFSKFGAPAAGEDALLTAYDKALDGEFGRYHAFALTAGFVLAVLLGVTAAVYGRAQRNVVHGAAALVAGAAVTIATVSLLPTMWFPLDRYPVGFVWMLRCLPVAAATWLVATLIARIWAPPSRTAAA